MMQSDLDTWEETAALTPVERDVWTWVENGPVGVREYARETRRSPGTVGNLLARARTKVEGGDEAA
jgi:DNA-binding CsgD family transcriptional regulator